MCAKKLFLCLGTETKALASLVASLNDVAQHLVNWLMINSCPWHSMHFTHKQTHTHILTTHNVKLRHFYLSVRIHTGQATEYEYANIQMFSQLHECNYFNIGL